MIASDLKQLGYVFQWSKLDAQQYLLLQRRNRVYGTADLDEGQDSQTFFDKMADTLASLSGDTRFNFSDVFDASLPKSALTGQAASNVQEAIQKAALKNESSNLFVDTSTSDSWETESAERVCTCVRPSHPVYSVKLERYVEIAEMFLCQGLFKNDFHSASAIEDILRENPAAAQDLAGNAFASTCAQAQLLASLVNASGWKHVKGGRTISQASSVAENALNTPSSKESFRDSKPSSDDLSDSGDTVLQGDGRKRKYDVTDYMTPMPSEKRTRFSPAPAALPFQVRV